MEAIKEINQIVNTTTVEDAASIKNVDETARTAPVYTFEVFELEGTNHKAREINAPEGHILISYDSKVELYSREDVGGEYMDVEFISKTYNNYSNTTAKHQHAFRSSNYIRYDTIQIYLKDETAQTLFNAAVTSQAAAREIKAAAINQYVKEAESLNLLDMFQITLKNKTGTAAAETLTSLINRMNNNGGFININTKEEELKTVFNVYNTIEFNNIKVTIKISYTPKNKELKTIRIMKIKPTYNSVLSD